MGGEGGSGLGISSAGHHEGCQTPVGKTESARPRRYPDPQPDD